MRVAPNEIAVVPMGIRFSVDLSETSRGYICEVFGTHFTIPSLGPIGANGLANPRDVLTPTAAYTNDTTSEWVVTHKYQGRMHTAAQRVDFP